MTRVNAPTLAATVNRLIVARSKLPGEPPRVDFRTLCAHGSLAGKRAVFAIVAGVVTASCARVGTSASSRAPSVSADPRSPLEPAWATESRSPRPESTDAFAFCGAGDAAL